MIRSPLTLITLFLLIIKLSSSVKTKEVIKWATLADSAHSPNLKSRDDAKLICEQRGAFLPQVFSLEDIFDIKRRNFNHDFTLNRSIWLGHIYSRSKKWTNLDHQQHENAFLNDQLGPNLSMENCKNGPDCCLTLKFDLKLSESNSLFAIPCTERIATTAVCAIRFVSQVPVPDPPIIPPPALPIPSMPGNSNNSTPAAPSTGVGIGLMVVVCLTISITTSFLIMGLIYYLQNKRNRQSTVYTTNYTVSKETQDDLDATRPLSK